MLSSTGLLIRVPPSNYLTLFIFAMAGVSPLIALFHLSAAPSQSPVVYPLPLPPAPFSSLNLISQACCINSAKHRMGDLVMVQISFPPPPRPPHPSHPAPVVNVFANRKLGRQMSVWQRLQRKASPSPSLTLGDMR